MQVWRVEQVEMTESLRVPITLESDDLLPEYATEQSAGMDLRVNESVTLRPGERLAVGTGIRVAIPEGYEGQVRPRSGLALRQGLSIPNAPGTIDADYRGEVKVILINLGDEDIEIRRGDRIAQLVVAPIVRVEWQVMDAVETSVRGEGGFGSTGVRD